MDRVSLQTDVDKPFPLFEDGGDAMCLAVPGKIVALLEEKNLGLRRGKVDFGGIRKEVCLDYTPEAQLGDYVLVHVGFALTVGSGQRNAPVLCFNSNDIRHHPETHRNQISDLKE